MMPKQKEVKQDKYLSKFNKIKQIPHFSLWTIWNGLHWKFVSNTVK